MTMLSKKTILIKVLNELKNLQNDCDNIKIDILSKLNRENYVIELQKDKELLYMFFYNFS